VAAVAAPFPTRRRDRTSAHEEKIPPLTPGRQLARGILVLACAVSLALVLQFTLVSAVQQRSSQQKAFDSFRKELATGVAPIGPTDNAGKPIALGRPVAYLEIRAIGLRQVVVEGTTSEALFIGPGHRRDTPLPGQAGTSLIAGRRSTYGGPFAHIGALKPGTVMHVTTGQGAFDYRVLDVRRAGQPLPEGVKSGSGRLVLATASGGAFAPSDVLWVDADLMVPAVGGPGGRVSPNALPTAEKLMESDSSTLWALVLWLQALIVLLVGAIWAWHRWDRRKAWVVFVPALLFVALGTSGEIAKLLPNLL